MASGILPDGEAGFQPPGTKLTTRRAVLNDSKAPPDTPRIPAGLEAPAHWRARCPPPPYIRARAGPMLRVYSSWRKSGSGLTLTHEFRLDRD